MASLFQTAPTDSSSVHLGLLVTPRRIRIMTMHSLAFLGSKYDDERVFFSLLLGVLVVRKGTLIRFTKEHILLNELKPFNDE